MIEQRYRHILTNAQSHQGTLTDSDHRLVIDGPAVNKNKKKEQK